MLLALAVPAIANPKDSLVAIKDSDGHLVACGFTMKLNGVPVVACPASIFLPGTTIATPSGEKIEYSDAFVPASYPQRHGIVFLKISSSPPPLLDLAPPLSALPGTAILTLGFHSPIKLKKITTGKSKVKSASKTAVEAKFKITLKTDFTGAPILLEGAGSVIGMAVCLKSRKGYTVARGIPLDSDLRTELVAERRVAKEMSIASELEAHIKEYGKINLATENRYNRRALEKLKKHGFSHMNDDDKKELKKELSALLKALKRNHKNLVDSVKKSKAFGKLKIPPLEMMQMRNIARAVEICQNKSAPREKLIQDILDNLEF